MNLRQIYHLSLMALLLGTSESIRAMVFPSAWDRTQPSPRRPGDEPGGDVAADGGDPGMHEFAIKGRPAMKPLPSERPEPKPQPSPRPTPLPPHSTPLPIATPKPSPTPPVTKPSF